MFHSLPRVLGVTVLILGIASLLVLTKDASGQFINGTHQTDKMLPPIFDKGFRPGFGIGPVIQSPAPRPPVNNILGNNQGNTGNTGNGGVGGDTARRGRGARSRAAARRAWR